VPWRTGGEEGRLARLGRPRQGHCDAGRLVRHVSDQSEMTLRSGARRTTALHHFSVAKWSYTPFATFAISTCAALSATQRSSLFSSVKTHSATGPDFR